MDQIITPSDDLVSAFNTDAASGDIIYISHGMHTISEHLAPPDDTTLYVFGTVEAEDSAQDTIVERTEGASGITIAGPGDFVGNRDTVTSTGTKTDHAGLNIESSPTDLTI